MNNYRKVGNGLSPSALQLRKRILKNRSRAIRYGLAYFLGMVALAFVVMLALPPIIYNEPTTIIGLLKFLFSFEDMKTIVLCVLYITMLVITLLNVCRGFSKFKWLFKKTANDMHGFNRNVYAMLDMGRIFSASFTVVLMNYFLIALISQVTSFDSMFYIVLAVSVVIHFWCGVGGMKANFYDVDNGQVIEQKRVVGRFAPFIRNLLQVITVVATMYFLMVFNAAEETNAIILPILEAIDMADLMNMLWNVLLVVAIFVGLTVLTAHAIGINEYNIDGVEGKGMHMCYLFDIIVLALTAVAIIMSGMMDAMELWIVAGLALVMAVVEIAMWKIPKYPEDRIPMEKIDRNEEREIALNDFSKTYADSVVESTMDKSLATREDMEKNYVDNRAAMAAAQQKVYPNTLPGQPVAPYATAYGNQAQQFVPATQQIQQGQLPQQPVYPMPYQAFPPQPQQQQSLLPLVAGMSLLPMFANMSMASGINQAANTQAQGNITLPSQIVRDAILRNGSANDLEKVLFSDSELYGKGKQGRKAAKARAKALRMMARLNDEEDGAAEAMDEKAATDADLPIKIGVECPCCHKKLNVTSVAMYNRCPSCKTVFQVRKSQD